MAAAPGHSLSLSTEAEACAQAYAERLLHGLGRSERAQLSAEHPALAAARCGLHALTGPRDGAPRMPPAPLASCADAALAALRALPSGGALAGIDGAALLGERAACDGLQRAGAISPGGACRILPCADGHFAVQLARADDWALLPAWLECEPLHSWQAIAPVLRQRDSRELCERGALLGLAVAECAPPQHAARWCERLVAGKPRAASSARAPLVVDLSSLWAGPLCSQLLQTMGAHVIKVESRQRPDGARAGNACFFDLLNAGKDCVALDFGSAEGRALLRALIARADIVIEAARPRALQQMGIDAEACVAQQPGLSWISITGYGRRGGHGMRAAYGDDAAVGAGLAWMMAATHGAPGFVGDAVADPLTGLHAALCAWSGWLSGRGGLWSLALQQVVAHCIGAGADTSPSAMRARRDEWWAAIETAGAVVQPPSARVPTAQAAALGADTERVLAGSGTRC